MRRGSRSAVAVYVVLSVLPVPPSVWCRLIGHTPAWVIGADKVTAFRVCARCKRRL